MVTISPDTNVVFCLTLPKGIGYYLGELVNQWLLAMMTNDNLHIQRQ